MHDPRTGTVREIRRVRPIMLSKNQPGVRVELVRSGYCDDLQFFCLTEAEYHRLKAGVEVTGQVTVTSQTVNV